MSGVWGSIARLGANTGKEHGVPTSILETVSAKTEGPSYGRNREDEEVRSRVRGRTSAGGLAKT